MKGHIDIQIKGIFKPNRSYLFEVYRQACQSDITGSVVFHNPSLMFITAEGEQGKLGDYIEWCKHTFSSEEIEMTVEKKDKQMNYNEFRILKSDVVQKDSAK
ncbi:MAG: hypothetical protein JXA23_04300 [Bacteroidales bacterium]|nr:hypothetical protein [Bacteroidales bacterium]